MHHVRVMGHWGLDISSHFGPLGNSLGKSVLFTTPALSCSGIAFAASYKAERQAQGQAQFHLRSKFEAVIENVHSASASAWKHIVCHIHKAQRMRQYPAWEPLILLLICGLGISLDLDFIQRLWHVKQRHCWDQGVGVPLSMWLS